MKKSLLLMAMFVATTASFAQKQGLNKGEMIQQPVMFQQKKAPAMQTEGESVKANRSKATKLYYAVPEGATYMCWNEEGSGYAPSFIIVAPWKEFTFKNLSEEPTKNLWHTNYLFSDKTRNSYRDVTQYADPDGSYTTGLNPGYYMAAPTLVDSEALVDSFTIGYNGAYWGPDKYDYAFTQVVVDSINCMSFINDHGQEGSGGYGWGGLSTGYLYGTGKIDATSAGRGIGVCKTIYQDYPKPMSPLYVENIFLRAKSVTKNPLAEGKTLTMRVIGIDTEIDGEGKTKVVEKNLIAELTASREDFVEQGNPGTSQYSPTGEYQSYTVTFSQKVEDEMGTEMIEPFAIYQPFRVKIYGMDEEGVDFGVNASAGIDDEIVWMDEGIFQVYYPDIDATYNHYYTGQTIPFSFNAMFDAVEVEASLETEQGAVIEKTNILTVADDGQSSSVVIDGDDDLPGVYVYTAQPWHGTDADHASDEYYFLDAEEYPEWITSVNVDESKFADSNLNIVSVTAEPLPTGVEGRYAIMKVVGRGVVAANPIIVKQGNVEIVGIEKVLAAKNQSADVMFNMAGQRVNNAFKGLVIKNGVKMMNK